MDPSWYPRPLGQSGERVTLASFCFHDEENFARFKVKDGFQPKSVGVPSSLPNENGTFPSQRRLA